MSDETETLKFIDASRAMTTNKDTIREPMSDNTQELRENLSNELVNYLLRYRVVQMDSGEGLLEPEQVVKNGRKMQQFHITTMDNIETLIKSQTNQAVLEARIDELESMRSQMFNMYHIIGATMNDKEAISQFDYEFEERIATLRKELTQEVQTDV